MALVFTATGGVGGLVIENTASFQQGFVGGVAASPRTFWSADGPAGAVLEPSASLVYIEPVVVPPPPTGRVTRRTLLGVGKL